MPGTIAIDNEAWATALQKDTDSAAVHPLMHADRTHPYYTNPAAVPPRQRDSILSSSS